MHSLLNTESVFLHKKTTDRVAATLFFNMSYLLFQYHAICDGSQTNACPSVGSNCFSTMLSVMVLKQRLYDEMMVICFSTMLSVMVLKLSFGASLSMGSFSTMLSVMVLKLILPNSFMMSGFSTMLSVMVLKLFPP